MHKIVIDRAGHYDQLRYQEQPSAALPDGHVRIAVEACGVNYADCIVRMGLYSSAKKYVGWPITPGFEVAGRIIESGDGADALPLGTDVIAVTRFGGYSDELVVPRSQVWRRPKGLTAVQAAAMPSVSLTAWYALVELARPERGESVLVHSAAGGVGQALVQMALARGCRVVGVVRGAHKVDTVRALGDVTVVDKSVEKNPWPAIEAAAPDGFGAVFDANGVATLRQSYRHLSARGRLVIYGFATMLPKGGQRVSWLRLAWHAIRTPRFNPLLLTQNNHSVMGFNLSYLFDHQSVLERAMTSLLPWIEDGTLAPPPTRTWPLHDAAGAHRAIESGTTVGKLVLTTDHHTELPAQANHDDV